MFIKKNHVYRLITELFLINTVYHLINSVYRLINSVYHLINSVYQKEPCISLDYVVVFDKHCLSLDKQCLSTYKQCLSLDKQCLSNFTHLACHSSIPVPSLYNGLGRHQHSKKHKIRGYTEGNSHVLEIVEKGVFLAEKAMILKIKSQSCMFF